MTPARAAAPYQLEELDSAWPRLSFLGRHPRMAARCPFGSFKTTRMVARCPFGSFTTTRMAARCPFGSFKTTRMAARCPFGSQERGTNSQKDIPIRASQHGEPLFGFKGKRSRCHFGLLDVEKHSELSELLMCAIVMIPSGTFPKIPGVLDNPDQPQDVPKLGAPFCMLKGNQSPGNQSPYAR